MIDKTYFTGTVQRLGAAALAVALCACSSPAPEPAIPTQSQHKINDGDPETGEPGVMLIYHTWYGSMCTGTLLAPRVVLTAKHCVMTEQGQMLNAAGFEVGVGTSMYQLLHTYGVVDVRTTTGIAIEDCDVALLILDQDAQEPPYRYMFQLPSAIVGRDALLIGYGVDHCPDGNSGTKLRTTDSIVGWYSSNDFITEGRGANSGDSGGPVFDPDTMEVMGVISRGSGDTCDGYTVVASIQPWANLVNQALEDTGACAPSSAEEVCNDGQDNNCDGQVDEGCLGLGMPCTDDEECEDRLCIDFGTGSVCTTPCTFGSTADCPGGSYCRATTCADAVCAPGSPGPAAVGEPCQVDTDCADLMCGDPGTGTPVCMAPCDTSLGQCLAVEACAPLQAGATCGGCVPDTMYGGPYHLGERCTGNTECDSGNCRDDGGLSYCTQACDAENGCPQGFHCRGSWCVRGYHGHLADPCVADEDCAADLACFGADETNGTPGYCTATCIGGGACPSGSTCGGNACTPDGLSIGHACELMTDCLSQGCFEFGGEASCTLTCGRRQACPPLTACVISDNGMTLCQPHGEPLAEGPSDDDDTPKPKKTCATGDSSGGVGLPLLLLGLLLWRRRRR